MPWCIKVHWCAWPAHAGEGGYTCTVVHAPCTVSPLARIAVFISAVSMQMLTDNYY